MRKRVLLVHNFYQIGGGEHVVFENEKNMLLNKGHEVFLYTRSNDELKDSRWKLLLLPLTTIWSFRTYYEIRSLIKEHEIDVVHCHNTFPLVSPSVYYAARSLKIPVVQTVHNFRFLCPNGLFFSGGEICEKCREQASFLPALKNGCYRKSRVQTAVVAAMLSVHRWLDTYRKLNYIFLTDFNKEKFADLIDIHGSNVFVKPNFVSKPDVQTKRSVEKPVFLFAGRLDQNKGIAFLLEAWKKMPAECELHIYGDGPYRKDCEAAAAAQDNVRFYGFRPREEVMAALANATALVFPSIWYETFGMSWAESFSMGKPVLTSNLGNHGDFVRRSSGGVTYMCGDADAFCEAAKELLADWNAYSENALQFFESNLSEAQNYEMLSEIYDKVKHIP